MKSGPNPKIFVLLTAATVLCGVGGAFWLNGQIGDAQSKIEGLKKNDRDEKTIKAELVTLGTQVAEAKSKLDHLEQSVSQAAYIPTLLKELENVGKSNAIEVLGVRPIPAKVSAKPEDEKKKRKKPYTELDIEVRGRGSYRAVMSFVSALQSFPKIVAARTLSLTPKVDRNDPSGAVKLDTTIELRTYLFAPAKNEKKDDKTAMAQARREANNG